MNGPTVEIENGYLRGFLDPTVGGKPYYSFKGIYFADPPVGPRRFMVRYFSFSVTLVVSDLGWFDFD